MIKLTKKQLSRLAKMLKAVGNMNTLPDFNSNGSLARKYLDSDNIVLPGTSTLNGKNLEYIISGGADLVDVKPFLETVGEEKEWSMPGFKGPKYTYTPIAQTMFETASFHIVKPCNMKCKFCYATFDDTHVGPQISLANAMTVVAKLKGAGLQKITFAGGEPMLYKYINEIIRYSKKIGLTTSIITNGSLLTSEWLRVMRPYLDWVGLSVDSINTSTNEKIGRKALTQMPGSYYALVDAIQHHGYKLKINTVVNAYNWQEDMSSFIKFSKPERWKVFQALRVEGQNDKQFDEMRVGHVQYQAFLNTHRDFKALVPENNAAMTGSYLLIDPLGRLFENSEGKHTYSDPLQTKSVAECLKQINLDRAMFLERGGLYKW